MFYTCCICSMRRHEALVLVSVEEESTNGGGPSDESVNGSSPSGSESD